MEEMICKTDEYWVCSGLMSNFINADGWMESNIYADKFRQHSELLTETYIDD